MTSWGGLACSICCCSQVSLASALARADSALTVCRTRWADCGPPSRVQTQPWYETQMNVSGGPQPSTR